MLNSIEDLHECGYIHRDIKPSNFILGKGKKKQAFIIDFGLCKQHIDAFGTSLYYPRTSYTTKT